jgi:hypothetical protein
LLNVTVICLLLAAATVWAPPPPPEPPAAAAAKHPEPWTEPWIKSRALEPWKKAAADKAAADKAAADKAAADKAAADKAAADKAAADKAAADKAAADKAAADKAAADKAAADKAAADKAAADKAAADKAAADKAAADKAAADKAAADKAAADKAAADKAAADKAAADKAAVADQPQFVLLQKLSGQSAGFLVVEGTVKRFSQDFGAGARNPKLFLSDVKPELLSEWQNTPQEKRIFVIGAGEDSSKISELAKSLKSDGYAVFFYDFCRPLCSSKAVGAMFGTSGETVLYHTSDAVLSEYVTVEIAAARSHLGLDKQVALITTGELLAGTFRMYMAGMPTPTPSPIQIGAQ